MVLDGGEDGHAEMPVPAYVHAFALLAHKRALARLRLSKAAIQTNVQLDVAYTRQWCTRGCDETTDSEHHLLFECPALADVPAAFPELQLADGDLGRLMDEVYHPETVEAILDFTDLPYYQSYFRAISLIGCVSPV
jgi:hypothetical protein